MAQKTNVSFGVYGLYANLSASFSIFFHQWSVYPGNNVLGIFWKNNRSYKNRWNTIIIHPSFQYRIVEEKKHELNHSQSLTLTCPPFHFVISCLEIQAASQYCTLCNLELAPHPTISLTRVSSWRMDERLNGWIDGTDLAGLWPGHHNRASCHLRYDGVLRGLPTGAKQERWNWVVSYNM